MQYYAKKTAAVMAKTDNTIKVITSNLSLFSILENRCVRYAIKRDMKYDTVTSRIKNAKNVFSDQFIGLSNIKE